MTVNATRIGFVILGLLLIGGLVALQCPDSLCRACPSDEVIAKQGTAVIHIDAPAAVSFFAEPASAAERTPVLLAQDPVPPERVALSFRLII